MEVQPQNETRRNLFVGAIYGLWAAMAAAFSIPALAYLFLPPKIKKEDEWTEIGDVSRLTPNSPIEMTFRRNRTDGWKVISEKSTAWVVKQAGDQVVAFGPQCTHLGCAYHWDESKNQFLCPCHTSVFGVDGKVLGGPAQRALDRYETKVDGKKLLIGHLRQEQTE